MNRLIKTTLKHPLFLVGLCIKFGFLFYTDSYYINELFAPFLNNSISNSGSHPWATMPPKHFPYGSVLYGLLIVPKLFFYFIFGEASLTQPSLNAFSIKIMLLLFDLLLFYYLIKESPYRWKSLLTFYWLNPILFYISYIHGQLDIIPTALVFLAIIQLTNGKVTQSSLWMTAATLSKFNTIVIIPFLLAYIWNRNFKKQRTTHLSLWMGVWLTLSALGFLPLILLDRAIYISIGSPEALRVFSAAWPLGQNTVLYYGFGTFIALLARLCLSTQITREGLIQGCGLLFGGLILIVDPMPGWFCWTLPFIALFYTTHSLIFKSTFWILALFYLIYFNPTSIFPEELNKVFYGATFTLMQMILFSILITIYLLVIRKECPLKSRTHPIILGVTGDSGSGKDTLTESLEALLDPQKTEVVLGDDYHKWERGHQSWQDYTHLHPRANYLENLARHISDLSTGKRIYQPKYDHNTGQFTMPRMIPSVKTIIVQGLHTFYLRSMRSYFDLKIFLAPEASLRSVWKLKRDIKDRGHDKSKALESYKKRLLDSKIHIEPQKEYADWIITSIPLEVIDVKIAIESQTEIPFYVEHWLWNDTEINDLVDNLRKFTHMKINLVIPENNLDRIVLRAKGSASKDQIRHVAEATFNCLRHITRGSQPPHWLADYQGLNQLIALSLLKKNREMNVT